LNWHRKVLPWTSTYPLSSPPHPLSQMRKNFDKFTHSRHRELWLRFALYPRL
jgi:hypothetical protein